MATTSSTSAAFDYSGIDTSTVDPSTLDFSNELQDCATIAQTFERSAHSTPSEAAVFATFNRSLNNMKSLSSAAITSLSSYLSVPQEAAAEQQASINEMAEKAGISVDTATANSSSTSFSMDEFLQGFNINTTSTSTLTGSSLGNSLLEWAKDCVPCSLRLEAFLELNPMPDLLSALEADLNNKLSASMSILDMLRNFNIYGDFCDLLDLLNFMCIPDLQRIIAALMAMFLLEMPQLDGLIGILQAMIAPMFAPLLMARSSLLDKFVALVANPLECVLDVFEEQISKLNFDSSTLQKGVRSTTSEVSDRVNWARPSRALETTCRSIRPLASRESTIPSAL